MDDVTQGQRERGIQSGSRSRSFEYARVVVHRSAAALQCCSIALHALHVICGTLLSRSLTLLSLFSRPSLLVMHSSGDGDHRRSRPLSLPHFTANKCLQMRKATTAAHTQSISGAS